MKRAHQLSLLRYLNNPTEGKEHVVVTNLRRELELLAPKSRWRALLRILGRIPLDKADGSCDCIDVRVKNDWVHQHHGEFNKQVRDAIDEFGAREGMFRALYTLGYNTFPDGETLQPKQHLLKDFLATAPQLAWFKGAP